VHGLVRSKYLTPADIVRDGDLSPIRPRWEHIHISPCGDWSYNSLAAGDAMTPSYLAAWPTILVLISTCGFSQQTAKKRPIPSAFDPTKKTAPKLTAPKLTAKQLRASDLLQIAVAEAAGLEPDMRSFVLWHAALGVEAFDKKKGSNLLRDAFLASQSVEEKQTDSEDCGMEEVCHVRRFLQGSILREITIRSPAEAERLVPQADEDVQQLIVSFLIDQYTHKKNFERAKALLATAVGFERYPYSEATDLMLALPVASSDRFSIFMQAFNSFQEHGSKEPPRLTNDFGEMLVRLWQDLPQAAVVDAIDSLLSAAQEVDRHQRLKLSFSTQQGRSGSFGSGYEVQLFQLIPILEQLDKDRAEDLLKENNSVHPMLAQYPRGLQSVDSTVSNKPRQEGDASGIFSTEYSVSDDPGIGSTGAAREQVQAEIRRSMDHVEKEIADNPKQALADAGNLPLTGARDLMLSPRCQVLMKIAQTTATKNPDIANSALEQLRKDSQTLPLMQQGHFLTDVADLYLKMVQTDEAAKTLQETMKIAEKLYAKDADGNDPNLAFKGVWPSTGLWWKCIQTAATISTALPEQLISSIPDPGIAAFQRVAYANSLLGRRESPELAEQHKDGGASVVSF
jgi:hypothetical protein